jgi:hypothetical protein
MLFDVDFLDERECVSEGVYGGGAVYDAVQGDEEEVVFEVDDMVILELG